MEHWQTHWWRWGNGSDISARISYNHSNPEAARAWATQGCRRSENGKGTPENTRSHCLWETKGGIHDSCYLRTLAIPLTNNLGRTKICSPPNLTWACCSVSTTAPILASASADSTIRFYSEASMPRIYVSADTLRVHRGLLSPDQKKSSQCSLIRERSLFPF